MTDDYEKEQELPTITNDQGMTTMILNSLNFMCAGESPPMDHPHIYLTMGDKNFKHCLYCNTKFVYEPALQPEYTNPPNCFAGHITDINELMHEGYDKDNDV